MLAKYPVRKNLASVRGFYIFLLCFAVTAVGMPGSANAAFTNQQAAVNVLGQWDPAQANGSDPSYTRGGQYGAPGRYGLSSPYGQAVDTVNHRLFISDKDNHRVLVFNLTPSNTLTDYNPDFVLGQPDFGSNTSSVSQSGLSSPQQLAYTSAGNLLYVVDTNGTRVMVFDVASITNGENAVNVLGQWDPVSSTVVYDSAPALGFLGREPGNARSIALDPVGHRLFVSDHLNRILVHNLDANNQVIDRWADYVLGQDTLSGTTSVSGTNSTEFYEPWGMSFDSAGNRLFVVDRDQNRVLVFDVGAISNGEAAVNVLGQADFASNGTGTTSATMSDPKQAAYDAVNNRLYVSDSGNHRVLVFDVTAITDGEAAVNVLGQADFVSGSNGLTASAMNTPLGLFVDTAGSRLFVADSTNNRVLVFDVAAITDGEAAVNVLGQAGFVSSAGATTQAGMDGPSSITYRASDSRLFVGENNNKRILVFDVAAITNGEAAVNVLGSPNFTTINLALSQSAVSIVQNLVYDSVSNQLFAVDGRVMIFDINAISDGENAADVLWYFSPETMLKTYTDVADYPASSPYGLTARIGMSQVNGIALDTVNHRLYVADTSPKRVFQYDLTASDAPADVFPDKVLGSAEFRRITTGTGQNTFTGTPNAVEIDMAGNRLFVAESSGNRVMIFDVAAITNGENAANVLGQADFVSSGSATTQSGLSGPYGLAYDSAGTRLFVSDTSNNRIVVFDVAAITNGENATNVLGQADFVSSGSATTQSGLNNTTGLAYDASSSLLYAADSNNNRIIVFDAAAITDGENAVNAIGTYDAGQEPSLVPIYTSNQYRARPGMKSPGGSVIDTVNHRLYVANEARVLVYDLDSNNNLVDRLPDRVLGQPDFNTVTTGDSASALGTNVFGLALDVSGNRLFVGDFNNNRVAVYDVTTITNGEAAVNVLGQPGFGSSGTATTADGMNGPSGVAYDADTSRLYVANLNISRVLVFDVAAITDGEAAVNVLGQADFTSGGSSNAATGMQFPIGLSLDTTNNRLYVADAFNSRVTVFDITAITDGEAAVNVLGQSSFGTGSASLSSTRMNQPYYVAADPDHSRLFVADRTNRRVLVFDTTAITDGEAAVNVIGQADFTSNSASLTSTGYGSYPQAVLYDPVKDRLFVSDSASHRLLIYEGGEPQSPTPPSGGGSQPPTDVTTPIISSVSVTDVSQTGATVSWTTNEAGNSTVQYGTTASYGSTYNSYAFVTSHSQVLSELTPATTYHYRVCSSDSAANQGCSNDGVFSTLDAAGNVVAVTEPAAAPGATTEPPPNAPVDTPVVVTPTDTEASFAWTTSVPVSVIIRFGLTEEYGYQTVPEQTAGTQHEKLITGLASDTEYHYSVCSTPESGTETCSADGVFTTLAPVIPEQPTVPVVVVPVVPPTPVEPVAPVVPTPEPVTPPAPIPEQVTPAEPAVPALPPTTEPETPAEPLAPAEPVTPAEPAAPATPIVPPAFSESVISPIVPAPTVTGGNANLISPDDIEFFGGSARIPLTITGGNLLAVPSGTRIVIHLPDSAIRKPIGSAWVSVGNDTYLLAPTGSYTGVFESPAVYGDQNLNFAVEYADGSHDSVSMTLSVRAPGTIYETDAGSSSGIQNVRVTLLSQDGAVLETKDAPNGDYFFLVPQGVYRLMVEKDGYGSRTTLPFPATNIVAEAVEMVRIPKVESVTSNIAYVTKVAYVETRDFVQNPIVEETAENTSGIVLTAGVVNTAAAGAAAGTGIPYLTYLLSLMAHPTQMLARRARRKWGVVYNSLTKLPIDLAIVRLSDTKTGRIVRSTVTDKQGRYFFIVPVGTYKLTAIKAGFAFPAPGLSGQTTDTAFMDLNHGDGFEVDETGVVALNLPIEPGILHKTPGNVVADRIIRRTQNTVGIAAIAILGLATFISPSVQMIAILAANAVSYAVFRRISTHRVPKDWGKIEDAETGAPIRNAVARIFDSKFNKLLETQVTDFSGRYGFLVGKNDYYVTVEKQGYAKMTKGPFDFSKSTSSEGSVAVDVRLNKDVGTPTI